MALRQQPEQDKRKLTEEMVANLPGIRRVFKLTPPYNEKEIQDMKKAIKEENARQEEQRMGLQKMANEYYTKLNDDGVKDLELRRKIKSWIREQPKEDRTRLNNWFTRYGKVYAIPDKFWWFNLTDMQPEARAYVYFTKWLESSEEERKELRRIAKQIGGVWSDRFRARFNELRRKWEASQ